MATTNADLVRSGYEAARSGDLDAIASLLAPDVKWHGGDPSWSGACHNRDQALSVMRRAGGQGIGELVEVTEAGDKVVVVMCRAGSGDDDAYELVANLTTFRDGKVVEMVHFPNPEEAKAAAGL